MNASDGLHDQWKISENFFNFKVALKKLELRDNLKGYYTKWHEEFTHDEQFDHIVESIQSKQVGQIFKEINFDLDPRTDIILVKVDGLFDQDSSQGIKNAQVEVSFSMSASDVSFLQPNQTLKGVVST